MVLAGVHLTQGTSDVGLTELLGHGDPATWAVLTGSRLPRLLTAVTLGIALGAAGAGMSSVARNPLAAPDTLAVNAGAYLSVVAVAAFGIVLPTLVNGMVAFLGGLAGAAVVLLITGAGSPGPRLVLVGTAVALTGQSATTLVLLVREQETSGLFGWGNGSLNAGDLEAVSRMGPVTLISIAALMLMSRSLDILALGDDNASVLGLRVRRVRLGAVLLTVALTAAAVTVAGPVGFVGLCAPVLARLVIPLCRSVAAHRVFIPLSALVGALLVLGADVVFRAVLGAHTAVRVPTGVITTVLGAGVLVWAARRGRFGGGAAEDTRPLVRGSGWLIPLAALVLTAPVLGLLAGDRWVLLGDLVNWLTGRTGPALTFILDQRLPRVLAALTAGCALALAGCGVQAVSRNPLAEPGLLGVTAGAGLGAVILITVLPTVGTWWITAAALIGAVAAFALVYALTWRSGLDSNRLVIIGVGVWAAAWALTAGLIVVADQWNTVKALTWLSGTTYGRTLEQVVPVAVAVAVGLPFLLSRHRELDLLALDDDTPRVLGVPVDSARLITLSTAAVLSASAVSAIGVVAFVGLIAPHLARSLTGARHRRLIPVTAAVGAVLVSLADTLGRTVLAPTQLPAGLVIALVGTPYLVWSLRPRTRPAPSRGRGSG